MSKIKHWVAKNRGIVEGAGGLLFFVGLFALFYFGIILLVSSL